MSRPLRIEFSGAWYLVLNHSRKTQNAFDSDEDCQEFIKLLKDSSTMWNVRVTAYCLVPKHYHLLIQTPEANLSRCMRHINGIYTQRYNRAHDTDGSLFRGRFKCILLPEGRYLLEMVRYIHREPVRTGICTSVDEYAWTSHKGYISRARKWQWLHKKPVLSLLAAKESQQIQAYREFVNQPDSPDILKVLSKKKLPPVLGGADFMEKVKKRLLDEKSDKGIPEALAIAPPLERITEAVCDIYRIDKAELMKSRRGVFNEPRGVAIYLARVLRKESLENIAKAFGMAGFSSASSAILRVKKQMAADTSLPQRIEEIKTVIMSSA